MTQVVIENPVLNSPFAEPTQHFRFTDDGITDEVVAGRRRSSYFVPIARPRKKGAQPSLYGDWTQDRLEETKLVNDIRERVARWRSGGYVEITSTTRRLLDYWTDPAREKRFFFCQIEALETAIYLTEVARKYEPWIENALRAANDGANPGLFRIAHKMATGAGKTVVMGMLIAWHALNKLANPKDARFSDAFLIVAPGITIRDRLRVLLPTDPNNYYRQRDIVPSYLLAELGKAKIVITNFHAFQLRETVQAAKLTKSILGQGDASAFTETPDQMVRRVLRELGAKKNIVVLNDEAHHCYARRPEPEDDRLKGDDRKEAEKRNEEARVWLNGLLAVKNKIGVRAIYDLSATPFFLRGSGYSEGTLFPWVVSDFSLIDAIEAGLVKVPRVPVSDDSGVGDSPTYRDLWLRVRDELPKKGRGTDAVTGEPKLPVALQGALHTLYSNYEQYYRQWEQDAGAQARGAMPPVFIVVANNTNVSKLIYDYIAGWEKEIGGQTLVQAGALPIFRNDDGRGGWRDRPNTILVDSEQLESGAAMSDDFKQVAARELEEFKAEYRQRFPGRDADKLTDEDLLREVMNTVGKPGKLGEHVKCVVSVSMLTEGWDANTVTHILGVRAFGTQLLSEQVIGRALRRISYQVSDDGKFPAEYAEVFGVPFSFVPVAGSQGGAAKPKETPTRVRALDDRKQCAITFPRLQGYRYELPAERLNVHFTAASRLALSTKELPTRVENAPIVGETATLTLDDLKQRRPAEVAFRLADLLLRTYFRDAEGNDRPWLFPQLLSFCKRWMAEGLTLKDGAFAQMLLFIEPANDAVDRIYHAIVKAAPGTPTLKPILYPYDPEGSTAYVDFDTTREVYQTHFQKCHVNYVTLDSDWEAVLAERIENMPEVVRYVKNQGPGFTIPYTLNGVQHQYVPDYILCIDDGHGAADLLNLVIEVTGEKKKDKAAKVSTAATLWTPAVNNHGGFGRWGFLEITDPWNAVTEMRALLEGR